ncbi:hypothetical protein NL676_033164 [Syzygium grande]|nr:hypothetical protein NL676_033164 [Syzygium grande]
MASISKLGLKHDYLFTSLFDRQTPVLCAARRSCSPLAAPARAPRSPLAARRSSPARARRSLQVHLSVSKEIVVAGNREEGRSWGRGVYDGLGEKEKVGDRATLTLARLARGRRPSTVGGARRPSHRGCEVALSCGRAVRRVNEDGLGLVTFAGGFGAEEEGPVRLALAAVKTRRPS